MREAEIEKFLVKQVTKRGGLALKLNSTSMAGLPDRMVLWKNSHILFVELKAPGKKIRSLQAAAHRVLKRLGFQILVIDSKEKVLEMMDDYGI